MVCINQFCPSGIQTPKKCPALGYCDRGIPAKTVLDCLKDPEELTLLLYEISVERDELPWYKWACSLCESEGMQICDEDPALCPWKGKESDLIAKWLEQPERARSHE